MSETNITQAVTINDFMTKALMFLDERCPVGSGNAVSRADVAKAGGVSEENDALISSLINAHFLPGWKIRQGRDGGVCRVGEERPTTPKTDKFDKDWVGALNRCLNERISMDPKKPTPRDEIAYALATMIGEKEVLKLPNKISEALSMGLCPGFCSRRGAGIYRISASVDAASTDATAVSADATSVDTSDSDSTDVSVQEVATQIDAVNMTETDGLVVEPVVEPVVEVSAEPTVEPAADKKSRRNKK